MHNILQIGLGPVGRRVTRDFVERGLGRVIAAVDADPELAGRSLAECTEVALEPDLRVLSSLEAIEDWEPIRVALVTTSSSLESCMDTLRLLLARGKTVLSTCEELTWPWLRHPVLAQELDELAIKNGARLLGTGVNPGFLMDALPVALTTACQSVRSLRVERYQDAAPRRVPFQRKIGAGASREAFDAGVADGSLRHVGLAESLHLVAHALGFVLASWDETLEPVLAERDLTCDLGPIAAGGVCGVRQVARGETADGRFVELDFVASVGQRDARDRVVVDGVPSFEVVLPGGVHGDVGTSAVLLNSIRSLHAAPAGLHTMSSLPLGGCAPA